MKTTLIDSKTTRGAYDLPTTIIILDTEDMGRILLADGWGGNDVTGYQYRWIHGLAIKLKSNDTFDTLATPWNDCTSTLQAVIGGHDTERPILRNFSGYAIAAIAKRHGK
ncbi:MAG: hypothetical protein PHD09_07595 [Candidatus Omnitrophica bacterium]|nr:hypothetical protein [Candidatus Omnitrophota bacterium]